MLKSFFTKCFAACVLILGSVVALCAQENLLRNPDAEKGSDHWRSAKDSKVEEYNGRRVFVVRNGGSGGSLLMQDVQLKKSDIGKYALFIGRGSSERVNIDGSITGLPYLYGYMMSSSGGKIEAYLQGQRMLAALSHPDQWVTMFGIFRVVEGTETIRFFLKQAERKDDPQTGSAARFDNLGLYIFTSEAEASQFLDVYNAERMLP